MADQFIDPKVQGNLEQLLRALQEDQAKLNQALGAAQEAVAGLETLSVEGQAAQVEQARSLATARPVGAGSIEGATAAIKEEAAALENVNRLIARQIELQAEAANAARGTAGAAVGTEPRVGGTQYTGPQLADRIAARYGALDLSQGARETEAQAAQRERLIATAQEQASVESKLGSIQQRNILFTHQASNELARHGALTTEFINAAARGEVTLAEFGNQVGATIGKFAGWTGAAAAVYGTLAAVQKLAEGAIAGTSTVQQLHRTIDGLDNQRAAQAVIQLAHDTNTSMKEAGDAVFQFSRTFPNLDDATYAAGLALKAFKLDGVSVADQVKAQTAIHQQFGISAHGLGPIYDELAAGQREYNARITDQIPLLQRSASAVKNAGGDLQDYIRVTTIALRTTQLSGSQLGTAFLRSASTFLNPATSKGQADRSVLASLGINPNQNYTDLILSSLKRASTLTDAQRQQLSLAVFGPLLGGRTAGFFTGGPALLDEVQKKLSSSATKGTFLQEFAKELGTSQQQLKALGNNLEQLGAELAQSGLLAPLGLVVKGLNSALTLSTQILKVWSSLPGPVKEVAGIAAGLFAARSFTQARGLSTAVPFFGRTEEQANRSQISAGLRAQEEFYQTAYAGQVGASANAGVRAQLAERARNAAVQTGDETEIVRTQQAYTAALGQMEVAQQSALVLQREALVAQNRLNEFKALTNSGLTAEQAAVRVGADHQLLTLGRGKATAGAVGRIGGQAVTPTGILLTDAGAAEVSAAAAASENAGQEVSKLQTVMGKAGTAVGSMVNAVPGATTAIETGTTLVGTAGARVSGLVDKIGGWVPALLGLTFVAGQISSSNQQLDAAAKQAAEAVNAAAASTPARDIKQANQALQAAAAQRTKEDQGIFAGIPVLDKAAEAFSSLDPFKFGQNKGSDANRQAALARKAYNEAFQPLYDQALNDSKNIGQSTPARDRWIAEVNRLKAQATAFAAGDKNAAAPLQALFTALQGLYGNVEAAFKIGVVNPRDPFGQFKNIQTANVVQSLQAVADRVKLYGADNGSVGQLATAYEYLAGKYATSTDDKSLQAVAQAQSLFVDSIRKDAQDLIDQADVAGSKRQKFALLGQARALINNAKSKLAAAAQAVAAQVGALQAAYAADLAAIAAAGVAVSASDDAVAQGLVNHAKAVGGLTGVIDNTVGNVLRSVDSATNFKGQAKAKANADKSKLDAARKSLQSVEHANNQISAQLDQTLKTINNDVKSTTKANKVPASQDPFELTRLRRELQQARDAGNPVKAAQDAVGLAEDERRAARNEHEKLQAQIDLANAEKQLNQAIADRAQAYYTYLESTTDDPIRKAQFEVQAANAAISAAQKNGGTGTQAYYEALAKLNDSKRSLAKAIEDRTQAYFTLQESETRDPVKQALIEYTAATEAVANAARTSGTGSQAYYEAKAKQNDAKHKLADAHLTNSEDNIQFQLDLNRISVETAIGEYENLLKLHNLTKQQRQDLLRKINDLEKGSSSDFADLNLGTIRLPTPYEIRRGLLAAQQGIAVTNHYDTTIKVDGPAAATAVGAVFDRYHSGTGKAIARAKGRR